MDEKVVIRDTGAADVSDILALYPRAFPDEDLTPVVSALLKQEAGVLSLAAFRGDVLQGHVCFTLGKQGGALLAPLAVTPQAQRSGIGSRLVRAGFKALEAAGVGQVFVLGDPGYYGRFGFRPERDVSPPYPMPEEWADAWQSRPLGGTGIDRLVLPEWWMDPALWGP